VYNDWLVSAWVPKPFVHCYESIGQTVKSVPQEGFREGTIAYMIGYDGMKVAFAILVHITPETCGTGYSRRRQNRNSVGLGGSIGYELLLDVQFYPFAFVRAISEPLAWSDIGVSDDDEFDNSLALVQLSPQVSCTFTSSTKLFDPCPNMSGRESKIWRASVLPDSVHMRHVVLVEPCVA
jgi:hypothetical protein